MRSKYHWDVSILLKIYSELFYHTYNSKNKIPMRGQAAIHHRSYIVVNCNATTLTPPVMLWPIPEALANSTMGQLGRCSSSWNFGWYGSSMRILPHRLKNNAMAATHSIITHMTINASSVRITIGPATRCRSIILKYIDIVIF